MESQTFRRSCGRVRSSQVNCLTLSWYRLWWLAAIHPRTTNAMTPQIYFGAGTGEQAHESWRAFFLSDSPRVISKSVGSYKRMCPTCAELLLRQKLYVQRRTIQAHHRASAQAPHRLG